MPLYNEPLRLDVYFTGNRLWWLNMTHKLNPATGLYDRRAWIKNPVGHAVWRGVFWVLNWGPYHLRYGRFRFVGPVVLMIIGAFLFGYGLGLELTRQGILK